MDWNNGAKRWQHKKINNDKLLRSTHTYKPFYHYGHIFINDISWISLLKNDDQRNGPSHLHINACRVDGHQIGDAKAVDASNWAAAQLFGSIVFARPQIDQSIDGIYIKRVCETKRATHAHIQNVFNTFFIVEIKKISTFSFPANSKNNCVFYLD